MRKQELYRILIDSEVIFDALGQSEYFNRIEDLSIQFYQTGSPQPDSLRTEIYLEDIDG